jgi:hypothetical protein
MIPCPHLAEKAQNCFLPSPLSMVTASAAAFLIQRNLDKISTRKFDVGVFTQPGESGHRGGVRRRLKMTHAARLVTAEVPVAAELSSNLGPVQYRDAGHSHHRICSDRSLFPQESARRQ